MCNLDDKKKIFNLIFTMKNYIFNLIQISLHHKPRAQTHTLAHTLKWHIFMCHHECYIILFFFCTKIGFVIWKIVQVKLFKYGMMRFK